MLLCQRDEDITDKKGKRSKCGILSSKRHVVVEHVGGGCMMAKSRNSVA